MPSTPPQPRRVVAYVDGFNLYYGLKSKGWRRYYWLDLPALARSLMEPGQQLEGVTYCTARVAGPRRGTPPEKAKRIEASRRRQQTWLEALQTLPLVSIFEGHFLGGKVQCLSCGNSWTKNEEKMTDVQIATQMLVDAFRDRYDTALVISADSDLTPPVMAIREHFPEKRVVAVFPPKRYSDSLRKSCHAWLNLGEDKLRKSQLPDEVVKPGEYVLRRPDHWK